MLTADNGSCVEVNIPVLGQSSQKRRSMCTRSYCKRASKIWKTREEKTAFRL